MAVQFTKTVSLDKDVYAAAHDYLKKLHKFTSFSRFVNHLLRMHLINAGYELTSPVMTNEGDVEEYANHGQRNDDD